MRSPLLRVQNLQVSFPVDPSDTASVGSRSMVTVVDHIGFELQPGEALGLVGESGSGKTMTALALMGLTPATARVQGQIWFDPTADPSIDPSIDLVQLSPAQMTAYRGDHLGMIFQEPSAALNPVYTCGYQLVETIRANESVSRSEAQQRCRDLFREVQLPEHLLTSYPHQLSGGQQQRVSIAMAIACSPNLLIADEPTTALDVTVQAEILTLLRRLQAERGMALIFISHDLGIIAEMVDRVIVMYQGIAVESGPVRDLFHHPQHPYTQSLLACRPTLDRQWQRLPTTEDFMTVHRDPATGQLQIQAKSEGSSVGISMRDRLQSLAVVTRGEQAQRLEHLQSQQPLLQIRNLKTYYPIKQGILQRQIGEVKAVDDVSFAIFPGETLGLVGESGCGKSTLGRTILRLVQATAGEIIYDGDDLCQLRADRLRRLRRQLQLIFQDPFGSLNPRLSIGSTLIEPMALHRIGSNRHDRHQRAQALLSKVGLDPKSLDRFPHEFSGGQRQRICIARALAVEPRLVICDEAVSALDVSVQAQVLNLLKQLQSDMGLTYLFISHDLSVVKFMSDRIMVMHQGRIEEIAAAEQIYTSPQSEYTRKLIAAIPQGDPERSPDVGEDRHGI